MIKRILILVIIITGCSLTLSAQISIPGTPVSSLADLPPYAGLTVTAFPPSLSDLASEDSIFPSPYRYSVIIPATLDVAKDGQWDQTSRGMIWRVKVKAPGALAMNFYFSRFRLAPGATLYIYDPLKSKVLGAYTSANNSASGLFATELIPGDEAFLELFSPEGISGSSEVVLNEVGWAYRGVEAVGIKRGFGSSGACEVNVSCPEGNAWRNEAKGVALIGVKKGTAGYWCSGSLVNNTRNDKTPYFLTADHCGTGATTQNLLQWIFYFRYESPVCADPLDPPVPLTMTGAVLCAHGGNAGSTGSDFYLVRFINDLPDNYDLYMNGWNRDDVPSPSGVTIHQPQGDIKKISTYTRSTISSFYGSNPNECFWRVRWSETEDGHGVTEGGSSGSPLFNDAHLIMGTLTGGSSDCDSIHLNDPDYYGKFSWHWESNGSDSSSVLKYWLDPDNTGLTSMQGMPVGILNQYSEKNIVIYPNPCIGSFHLEMPDGIRKCEISLADLSGREVLKFDALNTAGTAFSVGETLPGIYILRVKTGNNIYNCKLIIR